MSVHEKPFEYGQAVQITTDQFDMRKRRMAKAGDKGTVTCGFPFTSHVKLNGKKRVLHDIQNSSLMAI